MINRFNKTGLVSVIFDPHGGKKDLMWKRLEARACEKESAEALAHGASGHTSEQEAEL